MTHLHITSWVLALILFFVARSFYKKGNEKAGKISHMILRLVYLLILYSGGDLLAEYFSTGYQLGEVIFKSLAGLWLIAAVEMILIKTSKGKPTKSFWIQLVIAFIFVLVLGFGRLPMGLKLF
ncbi:YisL family protein [Aquibacillus sediminis]|uniref:YisL family protein n=1 Tax=Aquibacillus sediminis TaxID=2574734 RepID=UPI001109F240|nr:YisL family protein [Aquibacillus sediminis]